MEGMDERCVGVGRGVLATERTVATIAPAGPARGLFHHAGFRRFWLGQTISLTGSQISLVALPLLAVFALRAGPFQVGMLTAAGRAPWLLFALAAGALADRAPRRPLLIWADLLRAAALAWIPVAAVVHILTMGQLYAAAFLVGTLTVLSDIAAQSLLPTLVTPAQVIEGNGKLEMSRASAEFVGPGLGGVLVQAVTAPMAVIADVMSFVASAVLLSRIRVDETRLRTRAGGRVVLAEIRDGMRFVFGHRLLRWNVLIAAIANLFGTMLLAILVVFLLTGLGLRPAVIGLVLGVGSLGAIAGSLAAAPLFRRIGFGSTLALGLTATAAGALLLATVAGPYPVRVAWASGAEMLLVFGAPVFDVAVISLRQLVTPDRLLGRTNATMRFVIFGTMPFGALAGGLLATRIGLTATVLVAGVGLVVPLVLALCSPLSRLQTHQMSAPEATSVGGSQ